MSLSSVLTMAGYPASSGIGGGSGFDDPPSASLAQLDAHLVAKLERVRERLRKRLGAASMVTEEELTFKRWLGHGSYGSAKLVSSSRISEMLVVKEVALLKLTTLQAIDQLATEVRCCARLHHAHIVRLRTAYLAGELSASRARTLHMVFEFAGGGTLERYLNTRRTLSGADGQLPTRLVEVWLAQICSAVLYMHKKQVLHRDLSAKNVLLRINGDALVADLGLSKAVGSASASTSMAGGMGAGGSSRGGGLGGGLGGGAGSGAEMQAKSMVGTPDYLSPELVNGQPYGAPSDAWAVGVMLYEMMALQSPFHGANMMNTLYLIMQGKPTEEAQSRMGRCSHPPQLREVASNASLLHPDPALRTHLAVVAASYPLPSHDEDWRSLVQHDVRKERGGGGGGSFKLAPTAESALEDNDGWETDPSMPSDELASDDAPSFKGAPSRATASQPSPAPGIDPTSHSIRHRSRGGSAAVTVAAPRADGTAGGGAAGRGAAGGGASAAAGGGGGGPAEPSDDDLARMAAKIEEASIHLMQHPATIPLVMTAASALLAYAPVVADRASAIRFATWGVVGQGLIAISTPVVGPHTSVRLLCALIVLFPLGMFLRAIMLPIDHLRVPASAMADSPGAFSTLAIGIGSWLGSRPIEHISVSRRIRVLACIEAFLLGSAIVRCTRSGGDLDILRMPLIYFHLPLLASFFIGLIVLRASTNQLRRY